MILFSTYCFSLSLTHTHTHNLAVQAGHYEHATLLELVRTDHKVCTTCIYTPYAPLPSPYITVKDELCVRDAVYYVHHTCTVCVCAQILNKVVIVFAALCLEIDEHAHKVNTLGLYYRYTQFM